MEKFTIEYLNEKDEVLATCPNGYVAKTELDLVIEYNMARQWLDEQTGISADEVTKIRITNGKDKTWENTVDEIYAFEQFFWHFESFPETSVIKNVSGKGLSLRELKRAIWKRIKREKIVSKLDYYLLFA